MSEEVKQLVKNRYGRFAEASHSGIPVDSIALAGMGLGLGAYTESEVSLVPQTALGLACGCGNPIAFADIQSGKSVVDLGCGGGTDVIIAANKAGEDGRVLGIDITPEMVERAKEAVSEANLQHQRIFFRVEDIEDIYPMPKNFADIVISNCVLNLCPDILTVYKNIFRILRPGGLLVVSDIVFTGEVPAGQQENFHSAWTGCLGGALPLNDHLHFLKKISFRDIQVVQRHNLTMVELEAISRYPEKNSTSPDQEDLLLLNDRVAAITVMAMRPPLA
jgi:arsenite methyltransferase